MPKPTAEKLAVYRIVDPQRDQALINTKQSKCPRVYLKQGDIVLSLGAGDYTLLTVETDAVKVMPYTIFHAKPIGVKVDWELPGESEFYTLMAGRTLRTRGLFLALKYTGD